MSFHAPVNALSSGGRFSTRVLDRRPAVCVTALHHQHHYHDAFSRNVLEKPTGLTPAAALARWLGRCDSIVGRGSAAVAAFAGVPAVVWPPPTVAQFVAQPGPYALLCATLFALFLLVQRASAALWSLVPRAPTRVRKASVKGNEVARAQSLVVVSEFSSWGTDEIPERLEATRAAEAVDALNPGEAARAAAARERVAATRRLLTQDTPERTNYVLLLWAFATVAVLLALDLWSHTSNLRP